MIRQRIQEAKKWESTTKDYIFMNDDLASVNHLIKTNTFYDWDTAIEFKPKYIYGFLKDCYDNNLVYTLYCNIEKMFDICYVLFKNVEMFVPAEERNLDFEAKMGNFIFPIIDNLDVNKISEVLLYHNKGKGRELPKDKLMFLLDITKKYYQAIKLHDANFLTQYFMAKKSRDTIYGRLILTMTILFQFAGKILFIENFLGKKTILDIDIQKEREEKTKKDFEKFGINIGSRPIKNRFISDLIYALELIRCLNRDVDENLTNSQKDYNQHSIIMAKFIITHKDILLADYPQGAYSFKNINYEKVLEDNLEGLVQTRIHLNDEKAINILIECLCKNKKELAPKFAVTKDNTEYLIKNHPDIAFLDDHYVEVIINRNIDYIKTIKDVSVLKLIASKLKRIFISYEQEIEQRIKSTLDAKLEKFLKGQISKLAGPYKFFQKYNTNLSGKELYLACVDFIFLDVKGELDSNNANISMLLSAIYERFDTESYKLYLRAKNINELLKIIDNRLFELGFAENKKSLKNSNDAVKKFFTYNDLYCTKLVQEKLLKAGSLKVSVEEKTILEKFEKIRLSNKAYGEDIPKLFNSSMYVLTILKEYGQGSEFSYMLIGLFKAIEQFLNAYVWYACFNKITNNSKIEVDMPTRKGEKQQFKLFDIFDDDWRNWSVKNITSYISKEILPKLSKYFNRKDIEKIGENLNKWITTRNRIVHKGNIFELYKVEEAVNISFDIVKDLVVVIHLLEK